MKIGRQVGSAIQHLTKNKCLLNFLTGNEFGCSVPKGTTHENLTGDTSLMYDL